MFARLERIEFNMASTGRMTCSKGPSDGVSLPLYSRPRNSVYTETGKQEGMTGEPEWSQNLDRPFVYLYNSEFPHSGAARTFSTECAVTVQ